MSATILLTLGIAALLLAAWLLVQRLTGRRGVGLAWAAATLLLSSLCFGWLGVKVVRKSYRRGTQAVGQMRQRLAPRNGREVYVAQFGQPVSECLTVVNHQDQIVPRLDCCIWLEFTCCPMELRRLLTRDRTYQPVAILVADSLAYSLRPAWWTPAALGHARQVRRKHAADNPNRDQLFVFSADSTHAYYCDMAD